MVIGSRFQLQSLQLDNFPPLDSNKLELVKRAKYLSLCVKSALTWDEHILNMCQDMNHFVHFLATLAEYFPGRCYLKYLSHAYNRNWSKC